ncbi:MAG: DUF1772 domain-containing protein [Reichenbachiella sp.]|uniref:anthrone oxygenase family protein n=5 Tax=Reichenbachiella sp. TaxID=2184521 RepID=UPI0032658CB9
MEFTLNKSILYVAVLLTGLSAGLFYAWMVSVIPGTKRVGDLVYLEVMQSINRAILNPGFYLIFFGSLLLLASSTIQQYQISVNLSFWLLLSAALSYLIGTVGVTMLGNVPLNEMLDKIDLTTLEPNQLYDIRIRFEPRWNQLHMFRTVFSVLAFSASLLAIITNK